MRRRNPRVVWLPQTNLNSIGPATLTTSYQTFILGVSGGPGDFSVAEIPLVADGEGLDPLTQSNTLADVESSGYRLRRVVGKIWFSVDQSVEAEPFTAIYTAGIIVRRTNVETGISIAQETLNAEHLGPGEIRNTGDPWVWRRSWWAGNNNSTIKPAADPLLFTENLLFSALDGPHVDQKTARIIGPEQRLFLTVSATITHGVSSELTMQSRWFTDLRVLGSMRTSSGNRRNSSR